MSSSRKKKVDSAPVAAAESQEAARAAIDAASPAIALFYTGGPVFGDAPARDLTGADLVRLIRIAGLRASGGEPVKPATPAQLADMAAALEASGAFSREPVNDRGSEPEAPASPAEEN
jgi:hypothetical protein